MDFEEDFFLEEEEDEEALFFEGSEDSLIVEELEKVFRECALGKSIRQRNHENESPLSLPEILNRVELCKAFFCEKFDHDEVYSGLKVIVPQDAPYLNPPEYNILVEYLRNGVAYVDFNRKPADLMAGLFLYQDAFPELGLELPPKDSYSFRDKEPKNISQPGSREFQLGMEYYDLGEIAHLEANSMEFLSCTVASAYYGYPLGKELLNRVFIGIRLKELLSEDSPVLTSEKSILLAGHCYLTGIGQKCNEEQAYLMYKNLAMKKNSSKGKLALAMCFFEGIWAEKDPEVGVNILKDAAQQGNATAIYQLILTYIMDETAPSLLTEAVELCKHPKVEGQALSSFLLGLFYTYGIGVEADIDRGLYFSQQCGDYEIQTLGNKLRARLMNLIEA